MNFLDIYMSEIYKEYTKISANLSCVSIHFKNYTKLILSKEISVTLSA